MLCCVGDGFLVAASAYSRMNAYLHQRRCRHLTAVLLGTEHKGTTPVALSRKVNVELVLTGSEQVTLPAGLPAGWRDCRAWTSQHISFPNGTFSGCTQFFVVSLTNLRVLELLVWFLLLWLLCLICINHLLVVQLFVVCIKHWLGRVFVIPC
jgi:hypothetical protein